MTDTPLDPATASWLARTVAMRRLTEDGIIHDLWQHIRFASDDYIPFVLLGALDWTAPAATRLLDESESLWVRPAPRPEDRFELNSSITTHDRAIWVGIRASASREDAAAALPALTDAVDRVHMLTDLLSLLYGMPLTWHPAVYLGKHPATAEDLKTRGLLPTSRSGEAMTTVAVNTPDLTMAVFPRYRALADLPDVPFRLIIRTAFNWHAQGNSIQSGLNRFLNYWAAIELLATYLYDYLPVELTGAMPKAKRSDEAMAILNATHFRKSCFVTIERLGELRRPTIRTKASVLSLFANNPEDLERRLFGAGPNDGPSMYSIRNDIAHGNVSQHHHDFVSLVATRLEDMRSLSRALLLRVLYVAPQLLPYLASPSPGPQSAA